MLQALQQQYRSGALTKEPSREQAYKVCAHFYSENRMTLINGKKSAKKEEFRDSGGSLYGNQDAAALAAT